MNEKNSFTDVCIENLHYPLKVVSKPNCNGENTITSIMIRAKIESIYEDKFETNILNIINNRGGYIGPNQLSSRIIDYLNSINALTIHINFTYPYFIEKSSPVSKEKFLSDYKCEYSIEKTSLIHYIKKYKVEVPVFTFHSVSDFINDRFDYPAKIIVEIEGLDTFFTEDIVESVEDNVLALTYYNLTGGSKEPKNKNGRNLKLELVENIKKNLCAKYHINSCSVRITSHKGQYSYSAQITEKGQGFYVENKYEGEHIFI
jgi:prenyltransferase beta subunit